MKQVRLRIAAMGLLLCFCVGVSTYASGETVQRVTPTPTVVASAAPTAEAVQATQKSTVVGIATTTPTTTAVPTATPTPVQDETTPSVTVVATAEPTAEDQTTETIVEDYDQGYWFYENVSQGVRIEIHRFVDTEKKILWYEADLQCSADSPLKFYNANEESPGKGFAYPERVMRTQQAVFGINDDQFGHRMYNHEKVGIVIRNGKIIGNATRKNGNVAWPTLDTAAFFADGSMRVFQSQEYTGEEYLEMGAQNVLSFGPWLVRDGEINPMFIKHFRIREPRSAIGMITPYHYVVISVEGRVKQSRGVGMQWLGERMQALGATEAFNLDGGKTCAIVFMGKKLQISNPEGIVRNGRSVSGMIGLVVSDQVPAYTGLEE